MKLWIDDIRPAPDGYKHLKSVNDAKRFIQFYEDRLAYAPMFCEGMYSNEQEYNEALNKHIKANTIEFIDIDQSREYIKLLDWLEETGRNYSVHTHSINPVSVKNIRNVKVDK